MAKIDDEAAVEALETGEDAYVPDDQSLWGAEKARAMLVVLSRRLGGDFARDVHDEIFARAEADKDGDPDDRSDGDSLARHLADPFWDELFAIRAPKK